MVEYVSVDEIVFFPEKGIIEIDVQGHPDSIIPPSIKARRLAPLGWVQVQDPKDPDPNLEKSLDPSRLQSKQNIATVRNEEPWENYVIISKTGDFTPDVGCSTAWRGESRTLHINAPYPTRGRCRCKFTKNKAGQIPYSVRCAKRDPREWAKKLITNPYRR